MGSLFAGQPWSVSTVGDSALITCSTVDGWRDSERLMVELPTNITHYAEAVQPMADVDILFVQR